MPKRSKPSIVFAHGLWADGSCFQKLIPTLQAEGHEVMASQHGLDSLKSDVDCVTRCFGRVNGPVVLVGHSYGGTLNHACGDGRIWLKPDGIGYFAGDLPEGEQKVVWATQAVPVPDLFMQKVDGVAWRSKPSWYVVATEDRTVQPELHRFVAKRAPQPSKSKAAMFRCYPNLPSCST